MAKQGRKFKTHGLSRAGLAEYTCWLNTKRRCSKKNKDKEEYKNYYKRGIRVCDRWKNSFIDFYEDVGKRPTVVHSLDRIDNNGNYEPNNCHWATNKEQARNRRGTIYITYRNEKKCLVDWSKDTKISSKTLKDRLEKGWSIKKTLETETKLSRYLKTI